jgi:hypothetical protein
MYYNDILALNCKTQPQGYSDRCPTAFVLPCRLSLVPQDPIIFSGTVRSNLDPFDQAGSDAAIWAALRQAGIDGVVKSLGVSGSTAAASCATRMMHDAGYNMMHDAGYNMMHDVGYNMMHESAAV